MHRRLLRNTLSSYLGQFIARGIWLFLTPFLIHRLGTVDYALWVLIGSVVAYGSLLNLGIGGAVIKYVAEYRARGENERARSLIATALCLYTGLGLIVILLSVAVALTLSYLFDIPPEKQSTATWLVLLMGCGVGISIPCSTSGAVLRGLQRYDVVSLISVVGAVLTAILTVTAVVAGGGVLAVVAVSMLVTMIIQVLQVCSIRRLAPQFQIGWRGADRSMVRPVLGFSSSLLVIDVGGRLQTKTDEMVIAAFLPVNFIAPYALARSLSEMVSVLTNQFVRVLLPLASELHAQNDRDRLRAVYLSGTRLTLAIALIIGCPLIIFREAILTLWVGGGYAEYGQLVMILALACMIETSQWPAASILQAMARNRLTAMIAICSGLANLALSVALAGPFGLTGVALGTLIPISVVRLAIFLPYSTRIIGVSFTDTLKNAFLPSLLPAVPAAVVLYILQYATASTSLLGIMAITTAGAGVYVAGYLNMAATKLEQQTCHGVALSILRVVEARLSSFEVFRPKPRQRIAPV